MDERIHLVVYNFGHYRKRPEGSNGEEEGSLAVVSVTTQGVISLPTVFKDDLVTRLPYRIHRQLLPQQFCDLRPMVFLDDLHVVALMVCRFFFRVVSVQSQRI